MVTTSHDRTAEPPAHAMTDPKGAAPFLLNPAGQNLAPVRLDLGSYPRLQLTTASTADTVLGGKRGQGKKGGEKGVGKKGAGAFFSAASDIHSPISAHNGILSPLPREKRLLTPFHPDPFPLELSPESMAE